MAVEEQAVWARLLAVLFFSSLAFNFHFALPSSHLSLHLSTSFAALGLFVLALILLYSRSPSRHLRIIDMIASTFKLVLLAATFLSPLAFAQNATEGNIPACVSTCITSAATVAGCNP